MNSSGLRLERVSPDMLAEIHAELLCDLRPDQPAEYFKPIFEYPWRSDPDFVGLALYDDTTAVGFIGLIFSEQVVAGQSESFCNVTSLIAKETHRAEAAMLLFQLRSLRDHTITNLSCNAVAYPLYSRVGFSVLDEHKIVLHPFTRAPMGRGSHWSVRTEPDEIRARLSAEHIHLLEDHRPYARHLLVDDGGRYCYILFTLGRRRLLRTARMHFISDKAVFAESWPVVRQNLWRAHRVVLAECDSRFLSGAILPGSRRIPLRIPRLYRSRHLKPEQVSNLYSEVVLLNLP